MKRVIVSLLMLLQCAMARADEALLPDPLTLDFALSQAGVETHHQIIEAGATQERAQSQVYQARAASEWQARFELQASVLEPSSLAFDQSTEEFSTRLHIEKILYDFGRSDFLQQSADLQHDAVRAYMSYVLEQRRLEITRLFLAVLLSDLKYTYDNEAMAVAYVQFDNAQERFSLRQLSDVEMLAAEDQYQNTLYQRMQSENMQRSSRAQLAEVLNRPGELASNLQRPEFSLQRELPEYQVLVAQAAKNNPRLQLLQASVDAAQAKVQSVQNQARPSLNAEMDIRRSTIVRSSEDDWRASLMLIIPLFEQQSVKSQVSAERSQWQLSRAMLLQEQAHVRQRVLLLWQQIKVLGTRLQQMKTKADFNELYLDRSRALYDLEVKTDLGDAMVAMSATRYQQAQVEFDLALAWIELDMITNATTEKGK
jgi:outer membrane protein TolC